ncbi:MAG: aquaporin [Sphingobacteriaceae bacterium]|nr:aquaporin [Sphingobacteriaceae bacterium]
MKKYFAEFLGTFALVFCGTGAIIIDQESGGQIGNLGIAITFGLIVAAMIYSFGEISGAHLNPAVTLALWMNKSFSSKLLLPYLFAQTVGALFASFTLKFLFPANEMLGATMPAGSDAQSFILEIILTFFLVLVIFLVCNGNKEQKMFAGLIIGFVILLEALFAGPICGASMNPVRSLAPALVSGHIEHLGIYLSAPFLGSIAAVFTIKIFKKES